MAIGILDLYLSVATIHFGVMASINVIKSPMIKWLSVVLSLVIALLWPFLWIFILGEVFSRWTKTGGSIEPDLLEQARVDAAMKEIYANSD